MDLGLEGKRALVLGASRGLGAAIARELAGEGARVLGVSRSGEGPGDWPTFAQDLVAGDAAESIHAKALELLGGVDILINNSGGPPPSTAEATDEAAILASLQPMLLTLTTLTRLVLPGMREAGFGRIVTITSAGVREPIPGLALSNTIRAALHGFMKTLSREVAADGITVNLLMPGQIDTDRLRSLHAATAERMGVPAEAFRSKAVEAIPTCRIGQPEEFAAMAAFLASARASYVTGQEIAIDGGMLKGG
ncbi:MAG: SDR family oxidoreductase [Erythrobacter sp.]|nr:SDR family oxidoreductase [Erythrobacter sp.]